MKLGFKETTRLLVIGEPGDYDELLGMSFNRSSMPSSDG
jgi:hypothetical protein